MGMHKGDGSLDSKSGRWRTTLHQTFIEVNETRSAHTVVNLVSGLAAFHNNAFTVDAK
jgi:hypothetical protein